MTITIRGGASGAGTITHASDASLRAYGTLANLTFAAGAAHYNPHINRILVPYKTDAHDFSPAAVQSDLFQPSGSATISAAFWALPVAVPLGGPDQLGAAEGLGGLALSLAPGLLAGWSGLRPRLARSGPLVSLGTPMLIVDLSTLAVTATAIDATAAMAKLNLWDERNTPRRSSVDLTFSARALAVYVSSCGPNPAEMLLLASVSAIAHLDRPVAADGGRITMYSDQATVAFVELGSGTTVFVLAPISIPAAGPEPAPIGLVLRNLFLKTTGPLGFFVFGKGALSGQDIAVDAGVVLIAFRRLLSIPMLPDPYAASFDYVATGGRIADGGVRVATSTPDLVAVVELAPAG